MTILVGVQHGRSHYQRYGANWAPEVERTNSVAILCRAMQLLVKWYQSDRNRGVDNIEVEVCLIMRVEIEMCFWAAHTQYERGISAIVDRLSVE